MIELGVEGQGAIELRALEVHLELNAEQARNVLELISGDLDPADVVDYGPFYNYPKWDAEILLAIDRVISGFGIASAPLEQDESGYSEWNAESFEYVVTGDIYDATIALYGRSFYLTTYGDAYEEWSEEDEDEDDEEEEGLY